MASSPHKTQDSLLLPLLWRQRHSRVQAWRVTLVVVLAALWLASLAARPLYKPDEARYGEIAREMAQSGDWVTPRLNGFRYFEKPPLQYWATAAALKVLGPTDWAARLFTGLMALFGVALVYYAGRRLFSSTTGALAAAVLAGCPLYLLLGQVNTLDMGVSVFLSAAIFAFALAHGASAKAASRRRWMLAFWMACALAVLSKGLIGLALPAATIALYVVLRRDWRLLRHLEAARGVALFLAITAPWFVAVSLRNAEFAQFFFVHEHWVRFTTTVHQRAQPAWYFLPVLAAGTAPWFLAIVAGWVDSARGVRAASFSPALFLGLWALVVFVFFSMSGSKLPGYILPMFPALAVLAGAFLAKGAHGGLLMAQSLLLAGAGIALGSGALDPLLARSPGLEPFVEAYAPWLAFAAVTLVVCGALAAAAAGAEMRDAAAALIAGGTLSAALACGVGHRVFAPYFSASVLARTIPAAARDAPVYAVETYDHTLPWSLRRPVIMVGHRDELAIPIGWDPKGFLPGLDEFRRAWEAQGEAYAFFAARDFERLRAEIGVPMQEVARGPRYVLLKKP